MKHKIIKAKKIVFGKQTKYAGKKIEGIPASSSPELNRHNSLPVSHFFEPV